MNQPQGSRPRLIDRWWVQLLAAIWILAIVTVYFRLQIIRLVQMAGLPIGEP